MAAITPRELSIEDLPLNAINGTANARIKVFIKASNDAEQDTIEITERLGGSVSVSMINAVSRGGTIALVGASAPVTFTAGTLTIQHHAGDYDIEATLIYAKDK